MDRSSLGRACGPAIVLFLAALLIHVLAPVDPDTGARVLDYGVVALVCLLAGLAWVLWHRLNWGRRSRLRITPESIAWFEGAGLLAVPPTHDKQTDEIPASEIRQIRAVRLTSAGATVLRRKGGLDAWAADLLLEERRLRLSDLAWEADLNTLGRLRDFRSEQSSLGSESTGASAVPGPLMALRAAGYAIAGDEPD